MDRLPTGRAHFLPIVRSSRPHFFPSGRQRPTTSIQNETTVRVALLAKAFQRTFACLGNGSNFLGRNTVHGTPWSAAVTIGAMRVFRSTAAAASRYAGAGATTSWHSSPTWGCDRRRSIRSTVATMTGTTPRRIAGGRRVLSSNAIPDACSRLAGPYGTAFDGGR